MLLGWARDNPSSAVGRWRPRIQVCLPSLSGHAVTVSATDLGQLISFEEVFVESVYDLTLVPFRPTAILDCGAHVGFFSVLALANYPKVPLTLFEPNPENLDSLRHNLSAFDGPAVLHAAAVSIQDGSSRFAAAESNAGCLAQPDATGVDVSVLNLSPFVRADAEAALLLKIDIEGEEQRLVPHVLPVLPRRCAVFLETHHGQEPRQALVEQLVAHGFQVRQLRVREPYADLIALREA